MLITAYSAYPRTQAYMYPFFVDLYTYMVYEYC